MEERVEERERETTGREGLEEARVDDTGAFYRGDDRSGRQEGEAE